MSVHADTPADACATLIKSGERKGQWTACTCPDGPTRQPLPTSWRMRGGT